MPELHAGGGAVRLAVLSGLALWAGATLVLSQLRWSPGRR